MAGSSENLRTAHLHHTDHATPIAPDSILTKYVDAVACDVCFDAFENTELLSNHRLRSPACARDTTNKDIVSARFRDQLHGVANVLAKLRRDAPGDEALINISRKADGDMDNYQIISYLHGKNPRMAPSLTFLLSLLKKPELELEAKYLKDPRAATDEVLRLWHREKSETFSEIRLPFKWIRTIELADGTSMQNVPLLRQKRKTDKVITDFLERVRFPFAVQFYNEVLPGRIATRRGFTCRYPDCGKFFESARSFKAHCEERHSTHKCEHCYDIYVDQQNLAAHLEHSSKCAALEAEKREENRGQGNGKAREQKGKIAIPLTEAERRQLQKKARKERNRMKIHQNLTANNRD